ncbi:hypothetical protein VTN00DRAFT_1231 [Thermoascus crustaceus]|uniref:uncharacterized protein n=1 Tax=Thermoascus crustaceus TaxID=5088 RepID=UPI0037445E07
MGPPTDRLNLYILTFNCARYQIQTDRFASHLFDALPNNPARDHDDASRGGRRHPYEVPEILVLSLQEIAPIAYAFLGGSFLNQYYDAFDQAVHLAVSKQWADNNVSYVNMLRKNSGLTAIMVFVRSDVAGRISCIQTAEVGLGVQQMGNKGAVGARLRYMVEDQSNDAVDLTFVSAHLAPMECAFERRNKDWKGIVERLVFTREKGGAGNREGGGEESVALLRKPDSRSCSDGQSGIFMPTTYLFLAGDLNYRTSDTIPQKDDRNRFPQPTTDTNSRRHYSQLLKDDQLTRELQNNRTLHNLSEAPITFPPTYKYSDEARRAAAQDGEPKEWKWASSRWPSWCDRILYLDVPSWIKGIGHVEPHVYDALPLFPTSDHRAVALSVSVPLKAIPEPGVGQTEDVRLSAPFALDTDWECKRAAARTKEIIVGCIAYLGLTWEGNALLLASIGAVGGWLVLRSILGG